MDPLIQSKARQHLRDQPGARAVRAAWRRRFHMDYESIRAAMDDLASRQVFSRGLCARAGQRGWPTGSLREE
jgi:hypothetical protein